MSSLIHFDHSTFEQSENSFEPLVKRWAMQVAVECITLPVFIVNIPYCELALVKLFEVEKWQSIDIKDEQKPMIIEHLKKQWQQISEQQSFKVNNRYLAKNITLLTELMNLSPLEIKLLVFTSFVRHFKALEDVTDKIGCVSDHQLFNVLAHLFCEPVDDITALFSATSKLVGSGVIEHYSDDRRIERKLTFISTRFADALVTKTLSVDEIIQEFASVSATPSLCLGNYAHIQHQLDILQPYLTNALAMQKQGVNIFIYGPPGTGKTQLAKVLADSIDAFDVNLYEISSLNDEEDVRDGKERLKALVACQRFIQNRQSIVLIDEVEDIFNDDSLMQSSTAKQSKAWFTRFLENNRLPIIWVSNSITGVDPAFLRRFDFILELDVPTEQYRQEIIARECGELVSNQTIQELATHSDLSPAVINRATNVIASLPQSNTKERSLALKQIINNTLTAQGHCKLKAFSNTGSTYLYNPNYINADSDMQKVVVGLKQHGEGRLCLFGPPGTGKTAFGHYLAKQLDKKLILKKASDIISMYVGGTEQNLAKVFEQAVNENAVLMLDEVDSFLQDRKSARNSWEITAVNEMLTQVEAFHGIFIASTNFIDNLDQASIRRFDLKVKFDFLTHQQVVNMFDDYSHLLSLKSEIDKATLRDLTAITPGDFALIARRHKFSAMQSDSELLNALKQEAERKGTQQPYKMGFVH